MRGRASRAVALITLTVFVASCVTTRVPPISSVGAEFEPLRDERRLWDDSRDEESKLLDKVTLYDDPLLVDYLGEVTSNLNPEAMAANPQVRYRVRVIEDPTLNAFAYAHGSIFVHTGLLARMENESQLATVLAHEMTHVENRHMLRYRRSARNKQLGFSVAAIAGAVILGEREYDAARSGRYGRAATYGVLRDVLLGLGLQLAFIASVNGYGRDLEWEADEGGFQKMAQAGYDLGQAPNVYQALQVDHGDSSKFEQFFFGSHPQLQMRIDSAARFAEEHPNVDQGPRRTIDEDRFQRRIRPVIRDDARMNIELGRLELAEDQLFRVLELMPDDPEAHALMARLRLTQADFEKDPERLAALLREAETALREAIRLDPNRAGAHRELALLAYRNQEFDTACSEFRLYLEIDPRADDAARMRDYVLELQAQGHCPTERNPSE